MFFERFHCTLRKEVGIAHLQVALAYQFNSTPLVCCKQVCKTHSYKLVGYIVDLLMVVYTVVFCGRVHTTLIVAYGGQSTLLNIFGGYNTQQIKGAQIRHVVNYPQSFQSLWAAKRQRVESQTNLIDLSYLRLFCSPQFEKRKTF